MESKRVLRPRNPPPEVSPRAPLPQHILGRLQLLWVKQSSATYAHTSVNVLREVCSFLGFTRFLTRVTNEAVLTFDVDSMKGREVLTSAPLPVSSRLIASTSIGEEFIFVCGGYFRWALSLAFVLAAGVVHELPPMCEPRTGHSIVYYEPKLTVYVFGGKSFRNSKAKSSAEAFSLLTGQWRQLPDMIKPRIELAACLHKTRIYLCGGRQKNCEVFDVETHEFTLLPNCSITFSVEFSFVLNGELFMLAYAAVTRYDLEEQRLRKSEDWSLDCFYDNGEVLVRDGRFFALGRSKCYCYDIATHALLSKTNVLVDGS